MLLLSGKPSSFVMMSKQEFLDPYEERKLILLIFSISGPTAEPNAAKLACVVDCPVYHLPVIYNPKYDKCLNKGCRKFVSSSFIYRK